MLKKSLLALCFSFISLPTNAEAHCLEKSPQQSYPFAEYKIAFPYSWGAISEVRLKDMLVKAGENVDLNKKYEGPAFVRGWYLAVGERPANCVVYRTRADRTAGLNQHFHAIIKSLRQKSAFSTFKLRKVGKTTLHGKQAKWFSADQEIRGEKIRSLEYFILSKGRLYNINFLTRPKDFPYLKGKFKKIAKTFAIKNR